MSTIKIRMYVGTGYAGANHEDFYEMPADEWHGMTEDKQQELLDELALEFLNEKCECSAGVVE